MTQRIHRLIVDCTSRLFSAYGVVLRPANTFGDAAPVTIDPLDSNLAAAAIELRGVRSGPRPSPPGRLLFVSSFELVAKSRPPHGHDTPLSTTSAGDWIYVRDWTRELTNQLAGSVTNHLAGSGAYFSPRQPAALNAAAARLEMRSLGGVNVRFVSDDKRDVYVVLALPPEEDRPSGARLSGAGEVAGPGSVVMLDGDDDA